MKLRLSFVALVLALASCSTVDARDVGTTQADCSGSEGCACAATDECGGDLVCSDGLCEECPEGTIGCQCDPSGTCGVGLACDPVDQMCVASTSPDQNLETAQDDAAAMWGDDEGQTPGE